MSSKSAGSAGCEPLGGSTAAAEFDAASAALVSYTGLRSKTD